MANKLLVLDIDGVMTDGTKLYDTTGAVIGKSFCDLDFTAIKRFKAIGYNVCFLSGDTTVNENIAKKRNIDFYHSRKSDGILDKKQFISKFEDIYDTPKENMLYVGDDYFDLDIINELNYTFCPMNSPTIVKDSVYKILPVRSGQGVIASLYDELESLWGFDTVDRSTIDNLDKNERF